MNTRTLILSALLATSATLVGCQFGPGERGSFDRTYSVTSPLRLELSSGSGSVKINGSTDGKVHIHGEVYAGSFFGSAKDELKRAIDNPPIEQRTGLIRVGKDIGSFRNTSISYTIEVPRDTELSISAASGSQDIKNVRGPVSVDSASGEVVIENVDRSVTVRSASGSIRVHGLGDDAKLSAASGSIQAFDVKGDIRVRALSGSITIKSPGARVEADSASGSVSVAGANNDVKASTASGGINVQGNPAGNSYWRLKTASGSVEVSVPKTAGFNLSAEAISGQIQADLPIVIEDQGKHSLRARVGTPGGRVEVRTASGGIRIGPSS
ncbi:MAG: DUF4097 family beta strand repeat protein [Acidobacteria bacterium]|nr:DUF4097 family beta strand repeat protein [Acidobacteriota bacterium]